MKLPFYHVTTGSVQHIVDLTDDFETLAEAERYARAFVEQSLMLDYEDVQIFKVSDVYQFQPQHKLRSTRAVK